MYSRSKRRIKKKSTPKLKEEFSDIKKYDIICIEYPIWFGSFPCPLLTQLQKLDFENKIIMHFCTNEGSGIEGSLNDIKKNCKGGIIKEGLSIKGSTVKNSKEIIEKWIEKNLEIN